MACTDSCQGGGKEVQVSDETESTISHDTESTQLSSLASLMEEGIAATLADGNSQVVVPKASKPSTTLVSPPLLQLLPPLPSLASKNAPLESESNIQRHANQFNITLFRGVGDKVGIDIDFKDNTQLQVVNIKDGLIAQWNQDNPDLCVLPGDYIIDVNGTRGDTNDMLRVVGADSRLMMVISRLATLADGNSQVVVSKASNNAPLESESNIERDANQFHITLVKGAGDKVGIDVDFKDKTQLKVVKINDGLMSKWNQDNPEMCILPGDYIIDINDTRGDANNMLGVFKADSRLVMVISRLSSKLV